MYSCNQSTNVLFKQKEMDAVSITCDFERGLINACIEEFPAAYTIMCEFHFKQCLRKKLNNDLKFDQEEITHLIGPDGLIEFLFVLPPSEIEAYGKFLLKL